MTVDATQNNPTVPAVPPGSRVARPQDFRVELKNLPAWVRPEVIYWYFQWLMIRDACAGERQIKDLAAHYLPALEGMETGEYHAFVHRATYFNFSARTVSAMSGSIFRREPLIENVPADLKPNLKKLGKDGANFETCASATSEDVTRMGRYGGLLDLPATETTNPRPYLVGYTAENILDWDLGEDKDGRTVATRIVLREVNEGRTLVTEARKAFVQYRELLIAPHPVSGKLCYQQFLYKQDNADATLGVDGIGPIIPTRRGEPLDFIPFQMFGPHLSTFAIEKPPMEDIANLNISHYRSYAYLEHGRFFAGFPIYTAEEPQGGGDSNYKIGSSHVWVMPSGGKAHILEMNGQGLKFLENALTQKETQATSLGGKMLGASSGGAKGSDQLMLEERSEQSVLLKITRQLDNGYTQLLRWWGWWQGMSKEDADKIEVTFNKDFLFDAAGAREFRAVHAMYKDGVVPIDVVYYYLKKGNVIPDWMQIDEFKQLLDKMNSFPNQADAEARAEGFQNMQQKLAHEEKMRGLEIQQEEVDLQTEQMNQQNEIAKKEAATAAKLAAKPPQPTAPVPPVSKPGLPVPSVKPTGRV